MQATMKAYSSLYPSNWPQIPFHDGEIAVQKKLGVHESVMTYGPAVIRPYMPDQHRDFYTNQPFLVVAARDSRGKMWSTLLFGSSQRPQKDAAAFVASPTPTHLVLDSQPLQGDALEDAFRPGSDMGILGIEFATRRRNRVNGRIESNDGKELAFKVDQSFGNCPQYIKPRDWWTAERTTNGETCDLSKCATPKSLQRPNRLTLEQMEQVKKAETIFVATGYRGEGEDPRYGNDASHRGGSARFLKVSKDGKKIFLPDYAGNNMYMSLGNLMVDSRMGITIPLYETGGMIQMTGNAVIHWEDDSNDADDNEVSLSDFPGALRWLDFDIDEIVELPAGSLPILWDSGNKGIQFQVYDKVEESEDVSSFYLGPLPNEDPKWTSLPGQHLTVTLPLSSNGSISRSYSISSFQDVTKHEQQFFRISVRRDPFGIGSTYLHDKVEVGNLITVEKPSGDFYYQPTVTKNGSSSSALRYRTVLFLSAGIGVTPVLSMLHAFVRNDTENKHGKAIWVYSTRNKRHHAFKDEVDRLKSKVAKNDNLKTYVAYTRPDNSDVDFDFQGRIDAKVLSTILSQANVESSLLLDVYMCGPNGFIASMEDALTKLGVTNISYETF